MRRLARCLSGLAMLALAACSPGGAEPARPVAAADPAAVHAESGLPVIALSTWAGDKQHQFRVEVARTPAEQSRGLMFRTRMGADEGMIFPMDPPRMASFWMRNTVIPLDLLFIGTDRRIVNIAANAMPYSEKPIPSFAPVVAVLELNGGRAAELGLKEGDRVEW